MANAVKICKPRGTFDICDTQDTCNIVRLPSPDPYSNKQRTYVVSDIPDDVRAIALSERQTKWDIWDATSDSCDIIELSNQNPYNGMPPIKTPELTPTLIDILNPLAADAPAISDIIELPPKYNPYRSIRQMPTPTTKKPTSTTSEKPTSTTTTKPTSITTKPTFTTEKLIPRGLIRFPVKIAGWYMNFLFDSGCTEDTISESYATRCGLHIIPNPGSVILADGSVVNSTVGHAKATIKIGTFSCTRTFTVSSKLNEDGILGIAFMRDIEHSIDWRTSTLYIHEGCSNHTIVGYAKH